MIDTVDDNTVLLHYIQIVVIISVITTSFENFIFLVRLTLNLPASLIFST